MSLKRIRRALSRGRNPRKWWISKVWISREFRMSVLMFSTFVGREVSGWCKVLREGQQPSRYYRDYTRLPKKMQGRITDEENKPLTNRQFICYTAFVSNGA